MERQPLGPRPELPGSAIGLVVDVAAGRVTVFAPASAGTPATGVQGPAPSFALLGQNEIQVTTSNFSRSAVGAFAPSRVRVRFDLALTNKLLNADLVPSTFPTPPAAQVVAFPFATDPAGLFGLKVRASTDWNGTGASGSGAPHNFFNDDICIALTPPGDCFRWEAFGATVAAGTITPARTVGFDVDPSVSTFTVYVVLAADIRERPMSPGKGGIAGLIASPQRGALADITVRRGAGGPTTQTNASGFYSFDELDPGPYSIEVGTLPPGCNAPAAQAITVAAGHVAEATFHVTCPAVTTGSIIGAVSNTLGTPLAGVGLTISPGALLTTTGGDGRYGFAGLATGVYTVTVTNAPGDCATGATRTVPVTPGYTASADFVISCVASDPDAGAVILTEFGQNPTFTGEQWIELYNTTTRTINLDGWHLRYGPTDCRIGELGGQGTAIEPGAVRTVVGVGSMNSYFGLGNSMFCGPSMIAALVTQVHLSAPAGTVVDIVNFTGAGFPPTGIGTTLSLDPSAFDAARNDIGASWCASTHPTPVGFGTPGAINPPCPQTISLARNATDGTALELVGTVTASFRSGPAGQYKTYIQDATGGIALYPTLIPPEDVGTSVRVTGTRATFHQEAQVAVASLTALGPGVPVAPQIIGPAEVNDGSAEGRLVQVVSVEVDFAEPLLRLMRVVFADGMTTLEIDATYVGTIPSSINSATGVLAREPFGVNGAVDVLRLRPRRASDVF